MQSHQCRPHKDFVLSFPNLPSFQFSSQHRMNLPRHNNTCPGLGAIRCDVTSMPVTWRMMRIRAAAGWESIILKNGEPERRMWWRLQGDVGSSGWSLTWRHTRSRRMTTELEWDLNTLNNLLKTAGVDFSSVRDFLYRRITSLGPRRRKYRNLWRRLMSCVRRNKEFRYETASEMIKSEKNRKF